MLLLAALAWAMTARPGTAQESPPPVVGVLPVPMSVLPAGAQQPAEKKDDAGAAGTAPAPAYSPLAIYDPPLNDLGEPGDTAVRLGWWFVDRQGDPRIVGQYQGLTSNPWFEIDGLYSNRTRTLAIYGNQTDSESNQAALYLYGPQAFANVDFQRFIHRLDNVPLDNFNNRPNPQGVLRQDLNVGEDYAIRVEEFRGTVGTMVGERFRFRVDVWNLQKSGERQANAMAHCFVAKGVAGRNCHVLSQRQQIDWNTTEVTPRLEGRFGPLTVEYSRPMRQFTTNDQVVTRSYTGLPPNIIQGDFPYAVVPESLTQIDQLKASLDLGPTRQLYAFGYYGQTENQTRDVDRDFYGYDFRYTDWTARGTTLSVYARSYNQTGERPSFFVPSETQFLTPQQVQDRIRAPIDYFRNTAGLKGTWQPGFGGPILQTLTFTGGYEFDYLNRDFATYNQSDEAFKFTQGNTLTNALHVGVRRPWSYNLNSYARYKILFVENPLYGFRETSGVLNTGQPELRQIVEFGGGWYPSDNAALTVQQDIEVARTHFDNSAVVPGNVVNFGDQTYATTVTSWYAPTEKLSLTASASYYANWINQNITLGDDYIEPGAPPGPLLPPVTNAWFFGGTAAVLDFQINYLVSDTVRLMSGYTWVRGDSQFDTRTAIYTDLPTYSAVIIESNRFVAGVDWRPWPMTTLYARYNFFDYEDKTNSYNSGTAHMVFAGLSRVW